MEQGALESLRRLSKKGEAVFARDASERITYWSSRCEELLGLPAASVLGRHCHDVIGGRDAFGNINCLHNCRIAHQARDAGDPVRAFPLSVPIKAGWKHFDVETFLIPSYHPSVSTLVHVLREKKDVVPSPQNPPGKTEGSPEPLRPIPAQEDQLAVLTSREREIYTLLARGMTTSDIAEELRISPVTVRNHIAALLQRLDVHSKVAAVALAYRNHLL